MRSIRKQANAQTWDHIIHMWYMYYITMCVYEDDLLFIGMQQVQGRQFDDLLRLLRLFLSALHA